MFRRQPLFAAHQRILRKFGRRVKRGMRLVDQKSRNLFLVGNS